MPVCVLELSLLLLAEEALGWVALVGLVQTSVLGLMVKVPVVLAVMGFKFYPAE